jgi:hypothetical protein
MRGGRGESWAGSGCRVRAERERGGPAERETTGPRGEGKGSWAWFELEKWATGWREGFWAERGRMGRCARRAGVGRG